MFTHLTTLLTTYLLLLVPLTATAKLGFTEQIGTKTYAKLREVERYQIKVAEKFYLKSEFEVAADEYEKFLNLYPESPGAPYTQLMWSHCQRKLRHVNTAIREGYQSVVDYWPDSEEADLAEYMIAASYKEMGEVEKATPVFRLVADQQPDTQLALLARVNLLDIAKVAQDTPARLSLLEELTFKVPRNDQSKPHCAQASRELASLRIRSGEIDSASKALATTYQDQHLQRALFETAKEPLAHMHQDEATREQSVATGKALIQKMEAQIPDDLSEDTVRNEARQTFYRIASIYGATGHDKEIFDTYDRAAKLTDIDDDLRGHIANSHRHRGRGAEARNWYRKYENQIEGKRAIAYLARDEKQHQEAIDTFTELITEDGSRANEYQWATAECYERLGDHKKAIASYRQTDKFPHNYLRMAVCHRRMKQWGEALALYGQCKSDKGAEPEAMLQISHTLEESGKKESAIAAFQATCRAHPKSQQASRAHAHLQDKYGISITLGGAKDE